VGARDEMLAHGDRDTDDASASADDGTLDSTRGTQRDAVHAEDYECALCLRLLYEPVTLRCGHSFCAHCCAKLVSSSHAKCPSCRRVLPILVSAYDITPSLSLSRLLRDVFPEEYQQRKAEVATEVAESVGSAFPGWTVDDGNEPDAILPIFYLDSMLPRQRIQLNIFESRYRLMVRRCLEGSRHFGMVGIVRRRDRINSMQHGVEVEIVENELQPDGCMHIAVVARRRFKMATTWVQDDYTMAHVHWMLVSNEARRDSLGAAAAAARGLERTGEREAAAEEAQDNTLQVLQTALELAPLVEEWKHLVVTGGWERFPGQLNRCLSELGPMPAATDRAGAVERALWVGALINPLPALGVAPEIRPALLESNDALLTVKIAAEGVRQSLLYLTPSVFALWFRATLHRLLVGRVQPGAPTPKPQ
jgi:Lon protease-like protein